MEENNNKKRKIVILVVTLLLVLVAGATFAWWTWTSANNTKINFTVASTFSCSADGGGNITSNDITLVPSSCTNSDYAIMREITAEATLNGEDKVYMDLWLDINNIGTNLTNSQNFMYAITSSNTSCESPIKSGSFNGKVATNKVDLLKGIEFTATGTDTYYLWIWLDNAETNSNTMNQIFDLSLNGSCTTEASSSSKVVYMANIYDYSESPIVYVGSPIPSTLTQYSTPEEAILSLNTSFSRDDILYFLKHVVEDNIVTESYAGFIVTPTMAASNPGMTAGTYYLRGFDTYDVNDNCKNQYFNSSTGGCESPYYESNKTVLQNAFGSTYCTDYSSGFECFVPGLYADAYLDGNVRAYDDDSPHCIVHYSGDSYCHE